MIDLSLHHTKLERFLEESDPYFDFSQSGKPSWFDDVASAMYQTSSWDAPSYASLYKERFTYFIKDINGDNVSELFLLSNTYAHIEYSVLAAFTRSQGETVLLDTYCFSKLQELCVFDKNGFLHVEYNNRPFGRDQYMCPETTAIYQLLPGETQLTLVDHVELFYNGNYQYFRIENGERIPISYEEFLGFRSNYGYDEAYYSGEDVMRKAGLQYSYFYNGVYGK